MTAAIFASQMFASGGGGGGSFIMGYAQFQDQKPSGTNGGVGPGTGWNTRTLNTVAANNLTGADLAANVITLPAGTYYVRAMACEYRLNQNRLRLRNTADNTTILAGVSEYNNNGEAQCGTVHMEGVIVLAAPTTMDLQHFITNSYSGGDALGVACSSGDPEIFADVTILKIS